MSNPLTTVYCTDEDLSVRAGGDFILLCPKWQKRAYGADGSLAGGSWVLTSASASFAAAGVGPGSVVWLSKPVSSFKGAGELFGVDSVTATTATLHRVGLAAGAGLPPVPGPVAAIEYTVLTLAPQIEEASFALNRQYTIDAGVPGRTAANVYDLRDLRQACVLTVLVQRIAAELPDRSEAAWPHKLASYRAELGACLDRLQLRWGTKGDGQPPSTLFSTRLIR